MTYLSKKFDEGGIYKFKGFFWYYDSVSFSELKCLAEHSIYPPLDIIQKQKKVWIHLKFGLEFVFLKEIVVKCWYKTLDQYQATFGIFGAFLVNSQILYVEESCLHDIEITKLL